MSLMTSFYVLFAQKKIAYKNHMQLQRSRNSLASRFFTLSPKNGLKGNNNKNVRKKLFLLVQTFLFRPVKLLTFNFVF